MNLIARYVSTAIAGAVLMMWGVINFTVQFNQWRQGGDADWTWSWILSGVASLLPFVFGLWLLKSVFLSRPISKSTAKSTAIAEPTRESQA